jgi:hypothetical protein
LNQENDIIEREQTEIASRFNLLNKIKTRKWKRQSRSVFTLKRKTFQN